MKLNFGNCRLSKGLGRLINRETRRIVSEERKKEEKEEWERDYSREEHNNITIFIAGILILIFLLWFKNI